MLFILKKGVIKAQSYLVNTIEYEIKDIVLIDISYDEEKLSFYNSNDNKLVIKEYMNLNKKEYYAKTKSKSISIEISEGKKPFLKSNYAIYIEIYFPNQYSKCLSISTTNGVLDLININFDLETMSINNTNGEINIDFIQADQVNLVTTSGNIFAKKYLTI